MAQPMLGQRWRWVVLVTLLAVASGCDSGSDNATPTNTTATVRPTTIAAPSATDGHRLVEAPSDDLANGHMLRVSGRDIPTSVNTSDTTHDRIPDVELDRRVRCYLGLPRIIW